MFEASPRGDFIQFLALRAEETGSQKDHMQSESEKCIEQTKKRIEVLNEETCSQDIYVASKEIQVNLDSGALSIS